MDLSKLSDEDLAIAQKVIGMADRMKVPMTDGQLQTAFKVEKEARRQGVNPDFALPMVMIESQFKSNATSPAGAYGTMQLMPDRAKILNVNPRDEDENIEGGMRHIKELMSNEKIGKDPYRILAGYNAGPDNKFLSTGNIKDLPDETVNHMSRVSTAFGGELPSPSYETNDSTETVPSYDSNQVAPTPRQEAPYAVMGGVTGAGVATGIETGKKVLPYASRILHNLAGEAPNPNARMTSFGTQKYLNSQLPETIRLPLSELERLTGGDKIRTMSEVQQGLKAIQAADAQRTYKTTPSGGKIYTSAPGREAIDLSQYEIKPGIASKVALQAGDTAELVKGALPSVARIGAGALGGGLAGMQLYDAYNTYKREGLTPEVITKGLSGAGGALAMVPTPLTEVAGLALQAPEVARLGYNAIKSMKNDPNAQVDPLAAAGYAP